MKKLLGLVLLLIGCLSCSDIYVDDEPTVTTIVTYGTPYYYEGMLVYYYYDGLYYYPRYNYRGYSRPFRPWPGRPAVTPRPHRPHGRVTPDRPPRSNVGPGRSDPPRRPNNSGRRH